MAHTFAITIFIFIICKFGDSIVRHLYIYFQKRKDKSKHRTIERQIPDVPTLEEFECLLGESPTSYPKGESIENVESELHSASIDTQIYEQRTAERITQAADYKVFMFIRLMFLIRQSFVLSSINHQVLRKYRQLIDIIEQKQCLLIFFTLYYTLITLPLSE